MPIWPGPSSASTSPAEPPAPGPPAVASSGVRRRPGMSSDEGLARPILAVVAAALLVAGVAAVLVVTSGDDGPAVTQVTGSPPVGSNRLVGAYRVSEVTAPLDIDEQVCEDLLETPLTFSISEREEGIHLERLLGTVWSGPLPKADSAGLLSTILEPPSPPRRTLEERPYEARSIKVYQDIAKRWVVNFHLGANAPPAPQCEMTVERLGPSPTASPAVAQRSRITLRRQGGLDGRETTVRVEPDGRIEVRSGETGSFQPYTGITVTGRIERLQTLAASREFLALDETYLPEDPCCDRYEYTLTVSPPNVDFTKRVRTMDGVTRPAILEEMLTILTPMLPG